jgi:hypothetical protein
LKGDLHRKCLTVFPRAKPNSLKSKGIYNGEKNTYPLGRRILIEIICAGKYRQGSGNLGEILKENGRKRKDLVKIEDERVNGANVRVKEVSEE